MPRKKADPYEKMQRLVVLVTDAQWARVSALGASTPKQWPSHHIPELIPNFSKGMRRALALADPLIDAAIAGYKAQYDAQVARRQAFLNLREQRWKKAEDRERKEFYEEEDMFHIARKPV